MLSRVQLFVTPWPATCQAPLSMGFFQARIVEWVAISSSKGSSRPGDRTGVPCVSCIAGGFFLTAAPLGEPAPVGVASLGILLKTGKLLSQKASCA